MSRNGKTLLFACLLVVVIGWVGTAQAGTYYLLSNSGGQGQIGDGLPLPIQAATTGGATMNPIGTGMVFPPLLIPRNGPDPAPGGVGVTVQQTGSDPKTIMVAPGRYKKVPAGPKKLGVKRNNPKVWQVQTNITWSGPGALFNAGNGATFKKNVRQGADNTSFTPAGAPNFIPVPGVIRYKKTANRFSGKSRTQLNAVTQIKVWLVGTNAMTPCKHTDFGGTDSNCQSFRIHAFPDPLAVVGGTTSVTEMTPGTPLPAPGRFNVEVGPVGTIIQSQPSVAQLPSPFKNAATSVGYPWTTGMITISQPVTPSNGMEQFAITGNDARVNGGGTISLVAGGLSQRTFSGPNANRSWLRMPEPGAALGAAAALAVLALCHGVARRRAR